MLETNLWLGSNLVIMSVDFEITVKKIIQELPASYLQDVSNVDKYNYTFKNLTENKSIGLWYDKGLYYIDEYEHSIIENNKSFESEEELLRYIRRNY